jgi:hypothetical protein
MFRYMRMFGLLAVLFAAGVAHGAGDTPIKNLRLESNANGNTYGFTNLGLVAATEMTVETDASNSTQVVNWRTLTNHVAAAGLQTNDSPTMAAGTDWTFSLANVTNNADTGTEVVNWQTMTNYAASAGVPSLQQVTDVGLSTTNGMVVGTTDLSKLYVVTTNDPPGPGGTFISTNMMVVYGNIVPGHSSASLGSADDPWESLFVQNESIYLIGAGETNRMVVEGGNVVVYTSTSSGTTTNRVLVTSDLECPEVNTNIGVAAAAYYIITTNAAHTVTLTMDSITNANPGDIFRFNLDGPGTGVVEYASSTQTISVANSGFTLQAVVCSPLSEYRIIQDSRSELATVNWGNILGTLSNQGDLWTQLTNRYTKSETDTLLAGKVDITGGVATNLALDGSTEAVGASNGIQVVNWQTLTNALATLNPQNFADRDTTNTFAAVQTFEDDITLGVGDRINLGTSSRLADGILSDAGVVVWKSEGAATNGEEIVNWQTMTNQGYLITGGVGSWTNLSQYNNDSGFVTQTITNGLASIAYVTNLPISTFNNDSGYLTTNDSPVMAPGSTWTFALANVTNSADSGTEVVNYETMTNWFDVTADRATGGAFTMVGGTTNQVVAYGKTYDSSPYPTVSMGSNTTFMAVAEVLARTTTNFTFRLRGAGGFVTNAWEVLWHANPAP